MAQTVSVVTVGCGRNVVDSDELAVRLADAGWQLSLDGAVVVVNMCGFIESARTQSLDVLLDAAATGATVVAVGCMAERYGKDLAAALPEAAAVLSFDDYALTPRRHRPASRMACRARDSRGAAGRPDVCAAGS